ncbi:MAG: OmpA family protein [Desulfobacteraceae bacterium]
MDMFKSIICLCLMICSMITAGTVSAEIKAGAITLSPSIGGYVFEGNQDLENGPTFGLGLGYNMDTHWAAEAAIHYIDTERDRGGNDVNTWLYHLDAMYHFNPSEKLVPYLATGIGSLVVDPDRAHNDDDFAVNYGAGLKYFLRDDVALRGDVRHVVSFSSIHSNLLYTVGLTFSFGGVAEKTKVASLNDPNPRNGEKVAVILVTESLADEMAVAAANQQKIVVLGFEDVHFDFGESELKPEAKQILKRNILLLKKNPSTQIRIAGYTSAAGTEEFNQTLSEKRARSVEKYLVDESVITQDRLSTIGYGETSPARAEVAPKNIYSNAAKANMRVLFEVVLD